MSPESDQGNPTSTVTIPPATITVAIPTPTITVSHPLLGPSPTALALNIARVTAPGPAQNGTATPVLATSGPRAALRHEEDLPDDLRALSREERLTVILNRAQIREIAFFSYSVRAQFRTIWTAEGMLRSQYGAYAEGLPPRIRKSNVPRPPRGDRRE
jgi:hypothetical protein